MSTAYDRVAYPTAVFKQSHPERMAVLARLAGLDAALPEEARVLDIGGGNCASMIAVAAQYPGCEVHGFDLSEMAVARGQEFVTAAGLPNAQIVVEDILDAAARYPAGSFDCVVAHGVYAWVPPEVRAATMRLAAHVLSDRGVAMISYNCMPGGHLRLVMREMLLDQMGHVEDPELRISAMRDFLEDFAKPQENDDPFAQALRYQATSMLERPDAVLFHDELGPCFYPQRFLDVVADARVNGLRFLNDCGRNRQLDGFLPPDEAHLGADPAAAEDAVLRACTRDDYLSQRFFRHSTFVQGSRWPDRRIDPARMSGLWMSASLERTGDLAFRRGTSVIELSDRGFADRLGGLAALFPQRLPLEEVAIDEEQRRAVLSLFSQWYVSQHTGPAPFPSRPGQRPRTSPLVRAMIDLGEQTVCTLNHAMLKVEQPELRALLQAADGTRTIDEIAALDHGIPGDEVEAALTASCGHALLSA